MVQALALDVVSRIATGMGKPFDKLARIFAGPTAQVLSDPKAPVRANAVAALTAMADAAGLDSLISSFDKPLDSANPMLRKELLAWLEARLAADDTADLSPIAGSTLACLEDRTAEVRKSATAILPTIVATAGYQTVMELAQKLKPASRSTVLPLIESARSATPASAASTAAVSAAPKTASAASSAPASRPPSAPPSKPIASSVVGSKPMPAASRPTGASKTLRTASSSSSLGQQDDAAPVSRLAPRPKPSVRSLAAAARASPVPSVVSSSGGKEAPFTNADPKPKTIRAAKETGSLKWVVEGSARPDQIEALHQQMTPNTAPELLTQLFSKDHNAERDFATALTTLDDCARDPSSAASTYDLSPEELRARLVVNVDVMFKYVTVRLPLTSTTTTLKCLDLVDHLIPVLDAEGYKLSDYETSALLISLIAQVSVRIRPSATAQADASPF